MSAGREPAQSPPVTVRATVPEPVLDLLRHSMHAMAMVDARGEIVAANARAEPLLNSPTADLLGRPLAGFVVEHDRARLQKAVELAAAGAEAVEDLDLHLDRPEDGLIAASLLHAGRGGLVLVQMRDLTREHTERHRALEVEARTLREHSSANRKMIDLGGLISGVAHELRTPITYVQNTLALERRAIEEIGRMSPHLNAQVDLALEHNTMAQRGLERVHRLLHELRPLTKNKPHRAVRMDLAELVMEGVRTFRGTHTGDTRVELDLQATHPLPVDKDDLCNVIVNLLNNAAQAMDNKGVIRVQTRNVTVPPTIRVIDNGPGVPDPLKERIGEPFFTTKPDGTGLGLFISRRTVEAHGGTLSVEDTPGGGATFVVRLPHDGPLSAAGAPSQPA